MYDFSGKVFITYFNKLKFKKSLFYISINDSFIESQ